MLTNTYHLAIMKHIEGIFNHQIYKFKKHSISFLYIKLDLKYSPQ